MKKNSSAAEENLRPLFEVSGLFNLLHVSPVNQRPHPYVVGPKHVVYASKHGGMLTEETCKKVPCAHPRCVLPYEAHTYDMVALIQLKKNATNAEASEELGRITKAADASLFDGFALVETAEKFRIKG